MRGDSLAPSPVTGLGAALLPLLSLDTLLVAMALSRHGASLRAVLALAAAEAAATLVGYLFGALLFARLPGDLGTLATGLVLLMLGVHLAAEAREGDDEAKRLRARGWVFGVLAVSLDELGFGATLPGLAVSPVLAVSWILVQAPLVALTGRWLGRRLPGTERLRYLPAVLITALGVAESVSGVAVLLR